MGVRVREKVKGSGEWWIFIDHKGKRRAKKVGKDRRLAIEVAKKIEAKLILGDLNLSSVENQTSPTFGDYSQTWITITVPATCKASTLTDYQSILTNHVLPVFGKKAVTNINRFMVKSFLMEKIKAGFAQSTVTHMKNAISGVLNIAVDDNTIAVNPAHRLGKLFQAKDLRETINPLNREELSLLLYTFKDHYPDHYALALTLARTGLRLGEALALKWGDIDFRGRFITVQRNLSRGRIETPKTGRQRLVDMSKQLKETLQEHRHRMKLRTINKGWGQVPEWIFVNEDGKLLDSHNWRKRVFYKALERAGLRRTRIHDLRHTYASLLIQAGESLAYIRDQLGHSSIKMTVDIYGHLAPEGNKDAVDKLDDPPVCATIRNLSATTK